MFNLSQRHRITLFLFVFLFVFSPTLMAAGEHYDFRLYNPHWDIYLDVAAYSDLCYWNYDSVYHPYSRHEMLTGEWGAGIYYDEIDTDPLDPNEPNGEKHATWLTYKFDVPNWYTYTDFSKKGETGTWYDYWNDPNNPVWAPSVTGKYDTAKSIITDGKVQVTIDYEMVDLHLAFNDPNDWYGSPLVFTDDSGSAYVTSDRYIMLFTYNITNKDPNENTINGIEFYQLIHPHPANNYGTGIGNNLTYSASNITDPLEDYTPFNSAHQVGRFKHDITAWNDVSSGHKDYISFSSTNEPNWIDCGTYRNSDDNNSDGKPDIGTHINIEKRNLNEEYSVYDDEVAGAMGWSLGSLEPNETVSITLAFMFGHGEINSSGLWIDKYDNIDPNEVCGVNPSSDDPNDYKITYTIEYGNDGNDIAYNCILTDYLPIEVDYPVTYTLVGMETVCSDPNYDETNHTYTWDIGTLQPDDSGSVTLTVYANASAEPGGEIINEAILNSDQGWVKDTWSTPVCCYDNDIIYVYAYATGAETGVDWDNAYTDLQDALDRALTCDANEIWVARGIYKPDRGTGSQTDTFELVDGVPVYGGFNGTETSRSQRDFVKNKTILNGDIDTDGGSDSNKIVSIDTCGSDTILDGFIIADGQSGIYAEDSSAVITNCIVADNTGDGVYCLDSDIEISWSIIKNNTGSSTDGIHVQGSTSDPIIYNCKIRDNEQYGVYVLNGAPIVKNSWIHHNDRGIYLNAPSSAATIRGNTICDNYQEGIMRTSGTVPSVSNCILWGNDMDDAEIQLAGATTTYSCVYDPNTSSSTPDENGNITADPNFAYSDPDLNNYHLDPDSPCENKGNPSGSYTGEKDIDVQDRVYDSRVDMGADEITCDDVNNELDWTGNGIVNMEEFAIFSAAWLSHDPNDPDMTTDPNYIGDPNYVDPNAFVNWNPTCDINSDYAVDINDFSPFCKEWLWQACYKSSQEGTLMMLESLGGNDGETQRMSMMAEVSIDAFSFVQLSDEREVKFEKALKASVPKPTVKEQIDNMGDLVSFLEELWKSDKEVGKTIREKDWTEFMNHIYDWYDSLESSYLSEQK